LWFSEIASLFLRIRYVDAQILFDILKRISPSVRRNDLYAQRWIDNAKRQFRRNRYNLVKNIKNHLENHMSRRRGPRPR